MQNPNPDQEFGQEKIMTLNVDNYQDMLNIGPLGKEGVPFLLY
jgi:hypothetical protein